MPNPTISTRARAALPAPDDLKRLCQSLALLDALICPEWEARRFSFRAYWSEEWSLATMRNGSGDEFVALFGDAGAMIKGFAHESPMASFALTHGTPWPGVLNDLPSVFAEMLAGPVFPARETTFCLWHSYKGTEWAIGPVAFPPGLDPDGSASLLFILDGDPATYQTWAQEYYETRVDVSAVTRVYRHEALTNDLIALFSRKLSLHALANDLDEIGYPRVS